MKLQITNYICELERLDKRFKISRNQGLSIDNYLFSQIVTDINNISREADWGIRVPVDLKYSFSESDSVEILDLIIFLNGQLIKLMNITDVNHLNLKKFAYEFQNELEVEFKVECN